MKLMSSPKREARILKRMYGPGYGHSERNDDLQGAWHLVPKRKLAPTRVSSICQVIQKETAPVASFLKGNRNKGQEGCCCFISVMVLGNILSGSSLIAFWKITKNRTVLEGIVMRLDHFCFVFLIVFSGAVMLLF